MNSSSVSIGRIAGLGGALVASLVLASCGGGGGDAGTPLGPVNPGSGLVAASSVAGRCVAPRGPGVVDENGQRYPDVQGTAADEKSWVRSWIDETYLWYQDVRGLPAATLAANNYANANAYFDALKTPVVTTSGRSKDQFHFYYDTPTWVALSSSGVSYGYGFEIALISATPPRKAVIAYTTPGTPAVTQGLLSRGAQILRVDNVDLVNDNTGAGIDTLNAGLFPSTGGSHTFSVLDAGATVARNVTLTAAQIASASVQNVKTLPAPYQAVGYLQFNDHLATSERALVDAITQLKASSVSDLVIDMRYNGGGYLDVAAELAYMIAGPGPTGGKYFERLNFNDKNPFQLTTAQTTTPFYTVTQGITPGYAAGQSLPTLNLSRVYLLVGAGTCSASESVANGLRGAGVQVNLIGATTCGKPYGFYPTDNCGTTYFAIQFAGVNYLGQGDYADGLTPTCGARDDFDHQLGDPAETRLAAALAYRANGVCTPGLSVAQRLGSTLAGATVGEPTLVRSALRENRIYRK